MCRDPKSSETLSKFIINNAFQILFKTKGCFKHAIIFQLRSVADMATPMLQKLISYSCFYDIKIRKVVQLVKPCFSES